MSGTGLLPLLIMPHSPVNTIHYQCSMWQPCDNNLSSGVHGRLRTREAGWWTSNLTVAGQFPPETVTQVDIYRALKQ